MVLNGSKKGKAKEQEQGGREEKMNQLKNIGINQAKVPVEGSGIEVRHTLCSICNATTHCGIDAYVKDGMLIKVEGTKENPHNAGTLCSKGAASRQYVYNDERLLTPLIRKGPRGSDEFEPISWDKALDLIAERLNGIKAEHGPESVIYYVGYPKWQRPFVKRLAHSFGSPNFCSESSTCFTGMYLAFILNFGCFAPPDVKGAKCVLVWSANPFYSNTPVAGKILAKKDMGTKIIEVGPLVTPLTKHADIHLRIRPGTSGALALSMANVIISENLYDHEFINKWAHGFEEFALYVKGFTPQKGEEITGVPADLIAKAARMYATTKPAAILPSASPTVQHTNGVQNTRAMFALIGLTGNFDVPGGNRALPHAYLEARGGLETRELEFSQSVPFEDMPTRIGLDRFPVWNHKDQGQSMEIPFQIESGKPYPLKAMLAFGLNYRMWPGSDYCLEQLKKIDFLVAVDLFMTDSAKLADIILPACTGFEREEMKLYPGNFVLFSQKAIEPLGQSKSDVDIVTELAKRMTPQDDLLIKGHRACLDYMFEPLGLTVEEIARHETGYVPDAGRPIPPKAYEKDGFPTPSGKMEFYSDELEAAGLDPLPTYQEPWQSPVSTPDLAKDFPLILTTGARLPMFVHSRTFRMPWNMRLRPDPMVDMNPVDAAARDIQQGDNVELATSRGAIRVKANLTEIVAPGVVNMYHAYPQADVNTLIDPDYLDPISGFPGYKSLLAEVRKV
jgi:anaerobic selenocysteine-containing dehydrogenase